MTIASFGPLYIGLDTESFWDVWRTSAALSIHMGRVRIELDRPARIHHGSTQTPDHIKDNRQPAASL
jgi:hypothetical protein